MLVSHLNNNLKLARLRPHRDRRGPRAPRRAHAITRLSWPDHILIPAHSAHLVDDISCSESVDNFSDHLPLSFCLTISHPVTINGNTTQHSGQNKCFDSAHMVNWDKVTESDSSKYCDYVRNHLPITSDEVSVLL